MDNVKEKGATEEEEKEKNASSDYDEEQNERNVSFSFNLDLEDIREDLYSDSDAELEIDVSEIDNNRPPNDLKRKRELMDKDISVFNKMEEEIERQLDAKAARTNLTAKNVKNILKHVITNEHVMAMVKRRAYNIDDEIIFEPKLTRAKAKELAMTQPDIPWPITPVKKLKVSEVQVLIEEELPEDSSDEEYHPGQEEPSDDEREIENSVSSDLDSQPSTPATPADPNPILDEPQLLIVDTQYDEEGVFKVPGVPTNTTTESENIGQRTRSKFSLSETPLEQIEQAFVPPDITTDMYDWGWDADEDWNNFLKEFTQPLTQEIVGDDDPEADPEYNILEDEESDLLDKEELRMDKAVKVTRKELNNLVAELFEFADMFSKQDQDQEQDVTKKKKSSDAISPSIENTSINGSVIELIPVLAESNLPKLVTDEQRLLLDVQLSQHVQLMSQHFAMTYMHPQLHNQSKTCKDNLNSLRYLSNGENSAFNAVNLPDALKLVNDWEKEFDDSEFQKSYTDFVEEETALGRISIQQKSKFLPKFHPAIKKIFLESKALMYPQLLPEIPFRCCLKHNIHVKYLASEDHLIVLGLEQFTPFVKLKETKFKNKTMQLMDTAQLIGQYLIANRDPQGISKHINASRTSSKRNPIQDYYKTGKVSNLIHCIVRISKNDLKSPKEQPIHNLPRIWQQIIKGVEEYGDDTLRNRMIKKYKSLFKPSEIHDNNNSISRSISHEQKINRDLLNPTINMLPTMPFLNTPLKNNTESEESENNLNATGKGLERLSIKSETQESAIIEPFEGPLMSSEHREDDTPQDMADTSIAFEYPIEIEDMSIKSIPEDPPSEFSFKLDSNPDEDDSTQEESSVTKATDNFPETNIIPSPRTMSDCASPKNVIECDEQSGVDAAVKDIEHREDAKEEIDAPTEMDRPQLRKTTPRLAKIRSAQNMKMMAQILGNKGPSPNTSGLKPKGKRRCSKSSEEPSTSSNGDNEDEIAELMLASTTIKKDTAIRKRAKQARELENIKRLAEAENNLSQEERATKFAVSFLHKLHKSLDPSAEVFKAIVKLFLDYSDRIVEALNQTESDESPQAEQAKEEKAVCSNLIEEQPSNSQSLNQSSESKGGNKIKDTLTINLYKDICEKLVDYPELQSDFLLFLTPHQAAMIGKSVEHTMLQKMNDFVHIAQIYFAKQPSRLSKVMQAITQLASDDRITLEKVNAVMGPLLKGHPLVMDEFLQILPNGKPPESLFAAHMFENLTCPPGPHDKTKIYAEDAPELYESIEIPVSTSHEDPYGGDNCKCECHNLEDHNLKSRNEHCVSCGTRFLNGRIYLQTSEGLRPAKITFPGGDEEKQEHITRVSLKTVDKIVPATPTRRRKSSKNSPDQAESKLNKNSPIKESEEIDKLLIKSKRINKIPIKSKERKKSPKAIEIGAKNVGGDNVGDKKGSGSPVKTKREERAEKREAQDISRLNKNKIGFKNSIKSSKIFYSDNMDNATHSQTDDTSQDDNSTSEYCRVDDIEEEETKLSITEDDTEANVSLEKMEVSSDSGSEPGNVSRATDPRPWMRQEDAILLKCIKKDYSENTFLTISETLGDRTVQQVKERFEILLSLLERMT